MAIAMILMGVVMVGTRFLHRGQRRASEVRDRDAVVMGVGQAFALIPGVSRSGATITSAMVEEFEPRDSANLAFLLGIPAIAGAGLINFIDLAGDGGSGITVELLVGMVVAAFVGYGAIAALVGLIRRTGLVPFGWYCVGFGVLSLIVLAVQ